MERTRKIFAAKCGLVLVTIPVIVLAYAEGPPAAHTGAPGEQTCAQCHGGGAVNTGGGKVEITYSGGSTYTPGETGKFTVTITDSAARAFGFETSARLSNDKQAGSFTSGSGIRVVCPNDQPAPCADATTLQYIEQTSARTTGSFEFNWTAPASGSGTVRVFVAGNAANGNGRNDSGDHIYTANITLSEAQSGGGTKPAISDGGVADAFTGQAGVTSNGWTAIYGSNFSTSTHDWSSAPELAQGKLPLSLDNVSVTINGKSAPIYFISPGQINVLAPADDATGNVQVVVKNSAGESAPITARKAAVLPAIYAPFGQSGRLFATVVENSTGAILGKPGVEPRAARAVKPGDVVQFYASGLGATSPATQPEQVVRTPVQLANTPTMRIGDVPVDILGSALVGSGLYQINARIPQVANGDQPVAVTVAGTTSSNNVFITVQQ